MPLKSCASLRGKAKHHLRCLIRRECRRRDGGSGPPGWAFSGCPGTAAIFFPRATTSDVRLSDLICCVWILAFFFYHRLKSKEWKKTCACKFQVASLDVNVKSLSQRAFREEKNNPPPKKKPLSLLPLSRHVLQLRSRPSLCLRTPELLSEGSPSLW